MADTTGTDNTQLSTFADFISQNPVLVGIGVFAFVMIFLPPRSASLHPVGGGNNPLRRGGHFLTAFRRR